MINFFTRFGIIGFVIAAVIAIGGSFASYYNSDKIALAMSRAKPADPQTYARYHNLVEGLCIAAGLPKPRLYVIDDPAPNAFATGRNPQHAAIAVTSGLLEKMNRVELEAVLAHELSHVKNYDTLVMTLAVTMVGIIALLSDFFLRFMFWGGAEQTATTTTTPARSGSSWWSSAWCSWCSRPIIAALMQMAISRRREYQADASGVLLTRYPPGLISALEKLREDHTVIHTASKATAHLWIESPLDEESGRHASKFNHMFDTHPPLEDRIKVLKAM